MGLNILYISSGFLPANAQGGVPFSAYSLCSELQKFGHNVRVITTDRNGADRLDVVLNSWEKYEGIDVFYCVTTNGPYVYSPVMSEIIKEGVVWAEVVISSSTLWNYAGFLAFKYTKKFKKSHLVFVRGLLDSWAFKSRLWRKWVFWHLQGKNILNAADKIIALSESEKFAISRLGILTDIAVIPNGSPLVNPKYSARKARLVKNQSDNRSYILFMGRITAKKRIDQALSGFFLNYRKRLNSKFLIAGPIDLSYEKEFKRLLSQYPCDGVEYVGCIYGEEKHELLSNASGFVLTSASEGMPMAVLEAMQYQLPVIVTPECNFTGISEAEAGWVVELNDIHATAEAMDQIFLDTHEAERRGKCALKFASKKYNWETLAKEVLEAASIGKVMHGSQ
jgi:poly(glycerol-phosphate) alpha-glucosyltransferase